jgi:Zn-dependent protease with chaperone function
LSAFSRAFLIVVTTQPSTANPIAQAVGDGYELPLLGRTLMIDQDVGAAALSLNGNCAWRAGWAESQLRLEGYLSTHPDTADRVRKLRAAAGGK